MSAPYVGEPDRWGVRVVEAVGHELRMGEIAVRHEVFVLEQGVPLVLEIDARDMDPMVRHLVALDPGGRVVGTVRIIPTPRAYHLGRLAVRRAARGHHTGAALVGAVHELVARETPTGARARVELDAQVQARGFYEREGYAPLDGTVFLDAGIEHVTMARAVRGRAPH